MKRVIYLIIMLLAVQKISFANDYKATFCSSLEKVFIKGDHGGFSGYSDWPVKIQLAKNEHEGFQIIVKSESKQLTSVRIRANDFHDNNGHTLSSDNFSISPVGYVHIIKPSSGLSSGYAGWWPDPILSFLSSVDIKQGEYQPFFVSVYAPKGQAAGLYSGALTIEVGNSNSQSVRVEIEIWDFTIPDKPSLPAVLGLYTCCISKIYGEKYDNAMKEKYYNFLLDYKIAPDNLYSGADYIDILSRLKSSRWIGMLSLAHAPFIWDSNFDTEFNDFLDYAGRRYDAFEGKGLLDNAYIYIFDEVGREYKSKMQQCFQRIKQKFPDIPIMTTSVHLDEMQDYPNVDYFVAMYSSYFDTYRNTILRDARSRGKKVFWYTSNYPSELNYDIENPLLNIRILMGADAAKYRPDGYLFWAISRWTLPPSQNSHPVESGPYTVWDPQSIENFNGSGSWFYPGPDGPISSLRLEAYRDGVEDYEYYILLEKLIGEKQHVASAELIENARNILSVSSTIVANTDASSFTHAPNVFYNGRKQVAEAILSLEGVINNNSQDFTPPAPPVGVKIKKN